MLPLFAFSRQVAGCPDCRDSDRGGGGHAFDSEAAAVNHGYIASWTIFLARTWQTPSSRHFGCHRLRDDAEKGDKSGRPRCSEMRSGWCRDQHRKIGTRH